MPEKFGSRVIFASRVASVMAGWLVLMSAIQPLRAGADPSPSADSLIVSLDEVRHLADSPDLNSRSLLDVRQPRSMHEYDSKYPSQCQVTYNQDVAFGSDWRQFRSVGYIGASNAGVTQAVGVYADPGAARAAFERVVAGLTACAALNVPNYTFTVRQPDPSTIQRCAENQCFDAYRVKSSVLINVSVAHFPQTAEQIATTVLQTISDRI
jgi:PknH-like extracellular domain